MIKQKIKKLTDEIRGEMDSSMYKDYITGILFYKFLSDRGETETKIEDWKTLDDVTKSFAQVEEKYPDIFENVDVHSKKFGNDEKTRIKNIHLIVDTFKDIDTRTVDAHVFGDLYEWLLAEYSMSSGKKGGEFYTPPEVSQLVAQIVADKGIKSAYDPTCGTGSLLLQVANAVGEHLKIYGQEINATTYNLCRMGMILSGFPDAEIFLGNTLEANTFSDDFRVDGIVSNPPYSLKKWNTGGLTEDHPYFIDGIMPPDSKGDLAFILHSFYHLSENGRMAVVLPHGILFRGAKEGKIRELLVPYITTVIGLPANIFTNTSIPTMIIVIEKQQSEGILFIDASEEFEKGKAINKFTGIKKVLDTFKNKAVIDKFSYFAHDDEIKENEFNLNIPRYVDTFEPEPPVDMVKVRDELFEIEKEIKELEEKILNDLNDMKAEPGSEEWLQAAKDIFEMFLK